MQIKRRKLLFSNIALGEIFLLICMSFAVAFIMNVSFVSAADPPNNGISNTKLTENTKDSQTVPPVTGVPSGTAGGAKMGGNTLANSWNSAPAGQVQDVKLNGVNYQAEVKSVEGVDTAYIKETNQYAQKDAQGNWLDKSSSTQGTTTGGISATIGNIFGGTLFGTGLPSSLIAGAAWAGVAYGAAKL